MIVIPDVHGRTFWRQAVQEFQGKEQILFLGDYLDPYAYEGITPADAYKVFHEIIDLKKEHPDDITLLLGNHDLHYLNPEMEGGRMDYRRREQIIEDITVNANLFCIAESTTIGGKNYLFTHAGGIGLMAVRCGMTLMIWQRIMRRPRGIYKCSGTLSRVICDYYMCLDVRCAFRLGEELSMLAPRAIS